jgi:ABC-type polysaccharide/polyol phosphate transport system ATPase subunit
MSDAVIWVENLGKKYIISHEKQERCNTLLNVMANSAKGSHPKLTSRENIFLNGAILGMKRETSCQKFKEIPAFSEVEWFLDTPVKGYLEMYISLEVAVAPHFKPEILIVEVLVE